MCDLEPNGKTVLERRYLMRGEDGTPKETIEQMFLRVAQHITKPTGEPGSEIVAEWTHKYFDMMYNLEFLPNTPTFTGAGTALGQLAACFVLPIDDDIGKESPAGIFSTLRNAALVQQSGGGIGFSFSRLRPEGDRVAKSNGQASGPVSFMKVYDVAFGAIAQGGTRRGANMATLRVDHPDIRKFITCKSVEGELSNFNISVGITDKFMEAFSNRAKYDLINPRTGCAVAKVDAVEIMDMIVTNAWKNGEPGLLFIDRLNQTNPLPHLYTIETTNPCGEQALGPYENCCLGSINLVKHFNSAGVVLWEKLADTVNKSVRFLDDVVSANSYIPCVPELKQAAWRGRRIGLGFMGLADLLFAVGAEYGSLAGIIWAGEIAEFIQYHAMLASVDLATERGPFPAITGSIFDPMNLRWSPPTKPKFIAENSCLQLAMPFILSNRPKLDWDLVTSGIKKCGIRNAALTTVAPTGTIATVAGVEGYGIEPAFSLSYSRRVAQSNGGGGAVMLNYASRSFERILKGWNIPMGNPEVQEALAKGSIAGDERFPEQVRRVMVTAADVAPLGHIRMQAVVQNYFSNSISKTINLPAESGKEAVYEAYMNAWNLGCRGITVYVSGSRQTEVLTAGTNTK